VSLSREVGGVGAALQRYEEGAAAAQERHVHQSQACARSGFHRCCCFLMSFALGVLHMWRCASVYELEGTQGYPLR
jgi:hypothetical protein